MDSSDRINKNFLDNLTSKQAFVFGIVATILAMGTLGFVYTLSRNSASAGSTSRSNSAPARVAQAPAPTPRPRPAGGGSADNVKPITKEDHIVGPKDAKFTVVEFSDYECPFCKRFHPTMNQLIANNDDVAWVYRHFPLDSLHSKARKEAEAAECAGEQGKFWEMTDKIFEITPSNDGLNLATLPDIAKQAGVKNVAKFQKCLDSGKFASHVADNLADATASGGTGTPFSVIVAGDKKIPVSGAVPLAQIQSIIDSLR